jgi:hypothetical protein
MRCRRLIKIKKEESRALADVGVEIKFNLKSKIQIDRIMSQIDHYEDAYLEGTIIVLIGNTDKFVVS